MIDQRVSEGIECRIFLIIKRLTTTIPAQFVKKFDIVKLYPVYIERLIEKILF